MSDESKPTNNRVNVLLEWCARNHVFIDPHIRIAFIEDGVGCGTVGVFSTEEFIPPNYTLVRIPKAAVLSVRSCSLSNYIPFSPYGVGAQLTLSLALYVEILRGTQSRWHGYIQSLPTGIVDLPMFWRLDTTDISKDGDGREALAWLRGTEANKVINATSDDSLTTLVRSIGLPFYFRIRIEEEINRFYRDFAEPVLLQHVDVWRCSPGADSSGIESMPTLTGFYRAFSLVSSRAFLVDAFHGLSMVPIADAFNHIVENHVHLESDYNVCPECGSLQECPHDVEDGSQDGGRLASKPKENTLVDNHDIFYDMVSNIGIPPDSEIYNTYGEDLTNAQLLGQYGFILDVNDYDRLSWTSGEILQVLMPGRSSRPQVLAYLTDVLSWFARNQTLIGQSRLIFYKSSLEDCFLINGEGSLSHQLWSLYFVVSLYRRQLLTTNNDLQRMLQAVLNYQMTLEAGLDDEDDNSISLASSIRLSDPRVRDVLYDIGEMCMAVCLQRKLNSGKPRSHALDLSSDLPENAVRTQLALSLLISERSILDSCSSAWADLLNAVKSLSEDG
ncbi:hypothetical protein CVT26_005834 [Gymnopilus dilepis]|uniref:SET domain-containing protein n=1 Tax=Gymnopilus dilepis TaxID=231916 RepID=A0A409VNV6_9AGAR|nr:hypothetical protein CVT26_005834 [Gymnopilus dilepis]